MRSLAVTTAERARAMPDVPTMREVGYPRSNRQTERLVADRDAAVAISRL